MLFRSPALSTAAAPSTHSLFSLPFTKGFLKASEGKLSGKVGLTVEKANHMGVTFEVEAADESHKKDSSIKYGVRFNYKF